jgi:uncharacterized protein (TIRG00374 family)
VQLDKVVDALAASEFVWLVPGFALFVLGFCMRALRWRVLFLERTRPASWPALESLVIGQLFNTILPLRAGDPIRIVALNRRTGGSRAEIAATIVAERLFDMLALLFLLFVSLRWLPEVEWLGAAVALAAGLGLAVAAVVLVLARHDDRPLRALARPLAWLPLFSRNRADQAGSNLALGLASLRRTRVAFVAAVWTLASWLVIGLSSWVVMLAFDLGLDPLAGVFVVTAIGLSMILPSGPGALGVFEAAVVAALKPYGVSASEALSYALVLHALHTVPFLVAGPIVLHGHGRAVRERRARVAVRGVGAASSPKARPEGPPTIPPVR